MIYSLPNKLSRPWNVAADFLVHSPAQGDGLSLAELQPLIVPQYKEIMEQEASGE